MLDFVAHPLVEPSWVAAHLDGGDVRVVDARWRGDGAGRELYRQGHLPGAVHLDWQRDLSWTDERGVGYLLLPPKPFVAVMLWQSTHREQKRCKGVCSRSCTVHSMSSLRGCGDRWSIPKQVNMVRSLCRVDREERLGKDLRKSRR